MKNTQKSLNELENRYIFEYELAPKQEYKNFEIKKFHKVLDHKKEVEELLDLITPKLKSLEQGDQDLVFYNHINKK